MFNIIVNSDSRFKVNRKKVRNAVTGFLKRQEVSGEVEVGVSFVGARKIKELNFKFRGLNEPCAVLSFPLEAGVRGGFVNPPDKVLRLGDVVIFYSEVVRLSAQENVLIEEKIKELVEHGVRHLLGVGV